MKRYAEPGMNQHPIMRGNSRKYRIKSRYGNKLEIEPLKQLGINLSIANLQEYALSQGITTAYNSMTQAQKTMLRYNYIMSVTSAQQGDFARTAGSYANQVRLFTLNIQSLSSVIGQGLIAAVLPGIQALNALMSKLMQAAETFRNFMYVLMGKKIKGSTSGVVNDLAGLEDSSADLSGLQDAGDAAASGLDDATSSAKALKKALSVLPFDELNQLTDNSSSSGSTPGTGKGKTGTGTTPSLGLGGITNQIDDALNKEETPINKWAEKIRKAFLNHDWEGLGKTIADMLNIGIRKIYDVISWSNVGPKISAFCDAFTRSFNSLVENIHWDRLGRTVGAGINTLVNTFELLIGPGGIDFVNIGNKLATGLRGMIDEVNWPNLGQVLGSGFMISWNILDGFVQKMSKENNAGLTGWEQLGTAVADAMNGAFGRISFSKIATTIATGLNGAFRTLAAWTQNFNWDELVNNISNGINTFIGKFKWQENGTSLNTFITNLLDALVDIAETTDWESFGRGIGLFLSQIDWGSHINNIPSRTTEQKEVYRKQKQKNRSEKYRDEDVPQILYNEFDSLYGEQENILEDHDICLTMAVIAYYFKQYREHMGEQHIMISAEYANQFMGVIIGDDSPLLKADVEEKDELRFYQDMMICASKNILKPATRSIFAMLRII